MPKHPSTCATQADSAACEVAIVIEAATSFSRGVLRGVSQWMARHPGWLITVADRRRDDPMPGWLAGWSGDGMISGLPEHDLPRTWRGGGRPVVYVRDRLTEEQLPGVHPDDEAAARLAVSHLVDRGLRRLGICPGPSGTAVRRDAAVRFAQTAGCDVDVFAAPARAGGRPKPADTHDCGMLGRWLTSLPKPVGIIATNDVQALAILEACRDHGLEVPDDVALVAIADDDALCELATPAVTGVTHDRARLGREAARVLDEAMLAGTATAAVVLVPPAGITVRRSSDVLAVDDTDIRRAMRLIQERGCCDLSAAEVATTVGISRKLLDRKFQQLLGRTIHDELQRTRLAEAKRLLAETDHKLLVVSVRAGFTHAAQLCNVFKSAVGMSPMQYRKSARTCRELTGLSAAVRNR
jgi:LacI family transcriptional regulator